MNINKITRNKVKSLFYETGSLYVDLSIWEITMQTILALNQNRKLIAKNINIEMKISIQGVNKFKLAKETTTKFKAKTIKIILFGR